MEVIGEFNTYDDIEHAKKLSFKDDTNIFNKYCPVYPWSNEKLSKYFNLLDMKDKTILCPTASGDHTLEAIANDARKIICYDIDALSKYYSELKFCCLMSFAYERFNNELTHSFSFVIEKCDKYLVETLKQILSPTAYMFWNALIEKDFNVPLTYLNSDFPHNLKWLRDNISYLNDKNIYNKVKERLKKVDVKYVDSDIVDLGQKLPGEKFDYIFTSNILDYFEASDRKQILKMLSNLLNDDGEIISYTINDSFYEDGKLIYTSPSNERYSYDGISVYSYKKAN